MSDLIPRRSPHLKKLVTQRITSPLWDAMIDKTMPFHGQDAWRRHPLFTNLWKDPLPGFRPAVIVFSVYMLGEYAYKYVNYQLNAPPKKGGH